MFYFTSKLDPELVARKMEINDNVIPASNSVMANVLYDLGTILDKRDYKEKARTMANNVKPDMISCGKAAGGGILPVSFVAGRDDVIGTLTPGSEGSTFGGYPLASVVGVYAIKTLSIYQSFPQKRF